MNLIKITFLSNRVNLKVLLNTLLKITYGGKLWKRWI